jgi:DMSO/TMAO reductase YedYZ molybdopterin-dependent catalytic subunit
MPHRSSILPLALVALAPALIWAQAPQPAATASLAVTGDVATPLTLKAEDLAKMPREKVSVSEEDGAKVEYEGVPLREILKQAGAPLGNQLRGKALASYVIAKAQDGYQVVFAMGEFDQAFANEQILVADKRDGKPLFEYQGPFRIVCPNDKAGARSVRMLETLQVVRLLK